MCFLKRNNVLNDLKAKSVKNDLKGIWKTIKLASNINPSMSCDSVGNDYNNPESFNKHFATVGSRIQAQVPKFENISFSDFLPDRNSDVSFSEFEEVTGDAIISYVKSLASAKAVFDDIPLYILKEATPCIIEPLTHVVNL